MKYSFIGLGNMASAIIGGMVKSGEFSGDTICGCDISQGKCDEARKNLGICSTTKKSECIDGADVVVIAVKPQVTAGVFSDIKDSVKGKLIISIAAGKSIEYLEEGLGRDKAIIRVMPNINALVGAATSAYTANNNATDGHKKTVEKIFGTVGTVAELPEKLFSIFTAIGGSSPAFAYMYIDALARIGVEYGMTKAQALSVAASTVYGSAKMVMESGVHPWELCDRVCSPAGTTIDGVLKLQEKGFENAVHEAIRAVAEKDKRL